MPTGGKMMVASQEKAIEQARVDQVINAIDQQIEQVKEAIAEAHR